MTAEQKDSFIKIVNLLRAIEESIPLANTKDKRVRISIALLDAITWLESLGVEMGIANFNRVED